MRRDCGRGRIVALGPSLIAEPPLLRRGALHGIHVGLHVGPDQPPAHDGEREQAQPQPGEHEIVREPYRLRVLHLVQRALHRAVDRVVSSSENQHQPDQRDRQEGDQRFGEADDHPGPFGIGDLLHRGKGDAAGRQAGEVDPVDMEQMPGAIGHGRSGKKCAHEQDQSQDGEPGANRQEHVVPAGHGALGQAFVQGRGHGAAPVDPVALGPGGTGVAAPGAAGGAGDWRCSFRT